MLATFRAEIPFQFRILFPAVASALQRIAPFLTLEWTYYILTFLACYMLLSIYNLYLGLFARRVPVYAPILILFPLVWNHVVLSTLFMPSDFVGLLFFVTGLYLIHRKNWRYFYVLFPLAVFNRETAIYLTVVMLLTAWGRMTLRSVLLHALAQLAIWSVIKYLLFITFDHRGGDLYIDTLSHNLKYLGDVVGFRDGAALWLTLFGLVWLPGLTAWRRMPRFLTRQFLLLIPAFAALCMAGELWETRIFTELAVIVSTPTALLMTSGLKEDRTDDVPRPETVPAGEPSG